MLRISSREKWCCRVFVALFSLSFLSPFAHADVTIAAVGPLTGQDATTGEQMQRGAEAAIETLNATGGVLGQKINLILKDDACDPKQAVAIANQLAGTDVVAVIGHMCSGSAIPAAKIYNEEGILMISPSATSPIMTEQGFTGVLRTCGRDDQQGQTIADYIAKNYSGKTIAIVHDKTAYGQGLADEVQKDLHKHGLQEKLYDTVSRGERDYGSLLSKLKQNDIDILFFGGYHTEAGLIVRQMRDQGLRIVFIGDDDLTTKEFWSITGSAGEDALMSFNTDPRSKPEATEAVKQIRATGFDPEGITLYTYAAVQVTIEAIKRAGTTSFKDVATQLHTGNFPTVIGSLSFDAKGDVMHPDYIMYRWNSGTYVPVEGQ